MIHWINHNKISIFAAFVGAFIGFAYWHFIGCENGCTIKSVWWKMVGIGGLFGWVIGSWIKKI